MCFTITHQILFKFSISNKKQTARGTSVRFLLSCEVFDKTVNSWLRYGKSASKIVFWCKVESVLIFSFHVRKVQNSDSHKYVLGKRSNYRRSFPNIWTIVRHLQLKITNFSSFEHVFWPRLVPMVDEFIFQAICNILDWNNKTIFHQIQVCFDDIGKVGYNTNSLRSPPRCWTTFDAISTFTSSPASVARFSNKQNFLLELFAPNFQVFLRIRWDVIEIDDCPSPSL